MQSDNFVSINLIEENGKSLFTYPIIYYWDGNTKIEDSLLDSRFIKYISTAITTNNFHSTIIYLIYTFINESGEIMYHQDKFELKNIFTIQSFSLDKEYLWEVLNFLYKCAYKENYSKKYDFKNIFDELVKKYPKKINETVISNFIQSKLKETYKDITDVDIKLIIEKFYEVIK